MNVIRIFQNNLVTLVMFEKSSKREKSTTRKEEFYFSSGSNLIVCCFCGVLLSCILRFPLQKWSFCGQGVSNHSWLLSASHFLTRPFFSRLGTPKIPPRVTATYGSPSQCAIWWGIPLIPLSIYQSLQLPFKSVVGTAPKSSFGLAK